MAKELILYKCKHCGNIVEKLYDSGVPLVCCGEQMDEIKANTTEAAVEKHIPVVSVVGNTVQVEVGSTLHPMEEKHYIQWIIILTKNGYQRKDLKPGDEPKAVFSLDNDELIAVYEYCNLHGLWKKEL